MHNIQLVQILNARDDLVEELAGLGLFDPLVFNNEIKELAARSIFHYQIELLGSLNDLVQLDDVGMADHLEDVDFASHSFDVVYVLNLVFLENFDCNFLASQIVDAKFHFAKSAFANRRLKQILAHVLGA